MIWILTLMLSLVWAEEGLWDVRAKQWVDLTSFAATVQPGTVVVLGEEHADSSNRHEPRVQREHFNQLRLIEALGANTSLGMEFFPYPAQPELERYLNHELAELEFLKSVGWGGNAFDLYRPQVWAPKRVGGFTVALNAPRELSGKVSKLGPDGLSDEDRRALPPLWERGSATYFERFAEVMMGHVPMEAIERYFWAQSLWDDTMAWRATEFLNAQPEQKLVVIVGSFHAEYRDGLPARLRRHGANRVVVVLPEPVLSWDPEAHEAAAAPDAKYGARADYIWFFTSESQRSRPASMKLATEK